MKEAMFKKKDHVRIIHLNYKNFSAGEEKEWDEWYLDKTGIVDFVVRDGENNAWNYQVILDHKIEGSIRIETFFEYEIIKI